MTADTQGSVPVASPHGRLAGVVENLVRARRRSDVTTFLHGATTSLVIGLALFCLLELMYGVLGGLAPLLSFEWLSVPAWLADWRPGAVPQHLVIAVIGGVAALIVAQFTAISRRPGVGSMAQAADRRFALDERLSTALELAHAPTRSVGVVGEALLQDAARHSECGRHQAVGSDPAAETSLCCTDIGGDRGADRQFAADAVAGEFANARKLDRRGGRDHD